MGEWMYRSMFFLELGTGWRCVSTSRPGCFIPRGSTLGTSWIEILEGLRNGLDDVEKRKLPGLEL
jgi:hypothetical protein